MFQRKDNVIKKKNIFVFFLGELHFDPVARYVTLDLITKLHNSGIPIVYCDESTPSKEVNLDKRIDMAKKNVELFEKFSIHFSNKFRNDKREFYRPYFSKEGADLLLEEIAKISNKPPDDDDCLLMFTRIHELSRVKEDLKLLEYLKLNKISYCPIDVHHENQLLYIKDNNLLYEQEQKRSDIMIENIWNEALPELANTGGVIVCTGGLGHSERLAAKLDLKAQGEKLFQENIDLLTQAYYCYSAYSEEEFGTICEGIFETHKQLDIDAKIKEYISPGVVLFFEEDPVTGEFSNELLNDLIYPDVFNFVKESSQINFLQDSNTSTQDQESEKKQAPGNSTPIFSQQNQFLIWERKPSENKQVQGTEEEQNVNSSEKQVHGTEKEQNEKQLGL